MAGRIIGYARCFAGDDEQAQRLTLAALGVRPDDVYIDVGYVGEGGRPALKNALTAGGPGDTLTTPELHRLARSMRDLCDIVETLADNGARVSFAAMVFDLATPAGQLMLTLVSRFAKFESDSISAHEGVDRGRQGRRPLQGKQPKLSNLQRKRLLADYESGEYTAPQLCEISGLSRSAMYATLARARNERKTDERQGPPCVPKSVANVA